VLPLSYFFQVCGDRFYGPSLPRGTYLSFFFVFFFSFFLILSPFIEGWSFNLGFRLRFPHLSEASFFSLYLPNFFFFCRSEIPAYLFFFSQNKPALFHWSSPLNSFSGGGQFLFDRPLICSFFLPLSPSASFSDPPCFSSPSFRKAWVLGGALLNLFFPPCPFSTLLCFFTLWFPFFSPQKTRKFPWISSAGPCETPFVPFQPFRPVFLV